MHVCVCVFGFKLPLGSGCIWENKSVLFSVVSFKVPARQDSSQAFQGHTRGYLCLASLEIQAKTFQQKDRNVPLLVHSHFLRQVTRSGI